MKNFTKHFLLFLLFLMLFVVNDNWGQLSLSTSGTQYTIDFSSTISGIENGAYTATGFQPTPSSGQLNSNGWAVTGWSDGDLTFGGSQTTASTDYTRGSLSNSVTTGGFYSYTGSPGSVSNPIFYIQPVGSDFAPGTITLKIQNNTGLTITTIDASYNLFVRNDQGRSSSFNFSYSSDNSTYTSVSSLDYTSPTTADVNGLVQVGTSPSRNTSITSLTVANGSYFYIRWNSNDVGGSGSRDEFGLDDIKITCTAVATPPILTAASNVTVDASFNVTFTDNSPWRGAITTVKYGTNILSQGIDYTTSAGILTLIPSGSSGSGLRTAGTQTVTVVATGYLDATVSQTIGVGVATKLGMKTQPTAPASNGAVLAIQPAVYIQDQYGNTTTSTATVNAAVGSGTWTLGGTTSVAGVSGTSTFVGLTATSTTAVTGATISFSSGSLTGVTSGLFNIPAPPIYYSQGSLAPNLTTNWNSVRGGGGSAPANFVSGEIFVIQNGHTMTTSADWSVSGIRSKVWIENGGTLTATSPITLAAATTFQIDAGGTYKHNNTTAYSTSILQGTESFAASSNFEINGTNSTGPSGTTFGNLLINITNDQGGTINCGGGLTTINGNLTVQSTMTSLFRLTGNTQTTTTIAGNLNISGGTLDLSSGTSNTVVNLSGNFSMSGGTLTESSTGSGTINFAKTGTQTFTKNAGTISNTINFAVNSGSILDMSTYIIDGSDGTFTLSSGATLKTGNVSGITTTITGAVGSVQVTGTRTYSTGANYEYNGSSAQSTGNGLPSTVNSLTISNTHASGVTLSSTSSTGSLSLSGYLNTTSNLLTVTGTTTGSISRTSGYVNGPLARTLPASLSSGSTYLFPVGKASYNPFELVDPTTTSGGTVVVKAEVFDANCGGTAGTGMLNLNTNRYWASSITSGRSNFTNSTVRVTDASVSSSKGIAESTTLTGSYNKTGVNVSGSTITTNTITSLDFFALGDAAYSTLPYTQSFDGTWIDKSYSRNVPDNYWVNNTPGTGNNSWRREDDGSSASWSYSSAGIVRPYSTHSADFHTYQASAGASGILDLYMNFSTAGNKVLSFYYTNATGTDQLEVFLSTDGGNSFGSALATYTTGAWAKKSLSLGSSTSTDCVVRFKATSDYGYNDLGIDNVDISVRNLYTNDVGTYSVDVNPNQTTGTVSPKATIRNFGTGNITSAFNVTMTITGGYTSTKSVSSLAVDATTQVTFDDWTAASGSYTVGVCTGLTGDEDASNDCLNKSVAVSDGSWADQSAYPTTTLLGSGIGYTDNSGDDYLYSIGGSQSANCYKYNVTTNTWSAITGLPESRTVLATAIVGNYLYAIGGANASHAYQSTVYRYDITSGNEGSWLPMHALPKTIGWGKAVAYGNYIYLAGGYDGTNSLSDVYVYDVTIDAGGWVSATSLPGTRFGGAFSVTGTTVVYVAGAIDDNTLSNAVYRGTISSPTSISWTAALNPYPGNGKVVSASSLSNLSDLDFPRKPNTGIKNGKKLESDKSTFPPGSIYGFDAAPWGSDGIIIAGGTSYSDFTPADPNPCYIYKPGIDTWTLKQYVPTPVAGSSVGTVYTGSSNWKLIVASGWTLNAYTSKTQVFSDVSTAPPSNIFNLTSLLEGFYNEGIKNQIETPVTIELRDVVSPYSLVESKTVTQNNTGFCTADFSNVQSFKSYYIVVKYPNGLETWSAAPQRFIGNTLNYDFTASASQAFGNNMIKVGTKWCIYSGDIDQDASINAADRGFCWNDRTLTGYQISDINGDGVVNELDRAILSNNKNISAKFPVGFIPSPGKIRKVGTIKFDKKNN